MKNKGFTLIELLAVIVILAIIALIATPIILGIINDARESSKDRSAELVYNAVELAYQSKFALKGSEPTLAEVSEQLSKNGINKAEVNGNTITTQDGITCTLSESATVTLSITCTGTSTNFEAPTLATMSLATE